MGIVFRLFQAKTHHGFPTALLHLVLQPEFVLNFLGGIVQELIQIAVVVLKLVRFVVEHKTAQNDIRDAARTEVGVLGANAVVPLIVFRQVVQDVALFRRFILVRIEHAHVVGTQAQNGQLVVAVEVVLDLELIVVVGRQEGKANGLEEKLQVTASDGGEVRGFLVDGTIQSEAHFRCPHLENTARLVRASIL